MSDLSKVAMVEVLKRLRLVTICDCHEVGRGYDACRHTQQPVLLLNPELFGLWFDYCDAIEATGTKYSPESEGARRRLEDAVDLAEAECSPRPQ